MLKEKIVEAINVTVSGKNSFLAILKKNIETVLSDGLDESTADIDKRLEELQTELIQKANLKEECDNIVNEIYRLRDLRQETLSRNALRQDKRDRIAEMTDFLNTQTGDITEFDDKLVRKLIEKVTVFDDKLTVEFKSGVEIDIEIQDIRNGDQLRGVTSLIGGFSYLRIDFDCEYTYNNINNVVDIIINKEWTT